MRLNPDREFSRTRLLNFRPPCSCRFCAARPTAAKETHEVSVYPPSKELPARSHPAAATVAGHAPFPRDEVTTEYGGFERGREDRGYPREILPLAGEAAEGRWGNTALIQQNFPLRRLRRQLPR